MLFRVHLRRAFLGTFLQSVLPSILLTLVVFSSNLYYMERFEAAVTVNVTCLLSLSSFFIAVYGSLPKSPHVKIIDYLLLKCIILASATTLLQTFDLYYKIRRSNKSKRRLGLTLEKSFEILLVCVLPLIEFGIDFLFIIVGILYHQKQISFTDNF